jgi:hypothetical protein
MNAVFSYCNVLIAKRASLPADSVISYWKPEVAVRLVTDFTRYPFDHGKLRPTTVNVEFHAAI